MKKDVKDISPSELLDSAKRIFQKEVKKELRTVFFAAERLKIRVAKKFKKSRFAVNQFNPRGKLFVELRLQKMFGLVRSKDFVTFRLGVNAATQKKFYEYEVHNKQVEDITESILEEFKLLEFDNVR